MLPQTLESRIESLEHRVTELEQLPRKIDALTSQVSQLRTKMDAEFSAVCAEMASGSEMRALHEDVISRIALLQEAWAPPRRPRSRKK